MPEVKGDRPSSFWNPIAELCVAAYIMRTASIPKGLAVEEVQDSEVRCLFNYAKELLAKGIAPTNAALQILPETVRRFDAVASIDSPIQDVVALLKECSYRRALIAKLGFAPTDHEKYETVSTPALVQMVATKGKEFETTAKGFSDLVEKYVPSLVQKAVQWKDLQMEEMILNQQGSTLDYIVDEIIPRHRVTMLFGQEKSGKSIVAWDLVKHIANGVTWLNRKVLKNACLYIDLEDGILGSYIGWTKGVGPEQVRFITIRSENGIPTLDDPGLLSLCAEVQPIIVLDSLHKLFTREKERKGASAWNSGDYEPVLEKIRQLCVAGATVILIHHSTKADNEQYRDSSAIGANVDFLFAVVGDEPQSGVKRIHLIGKPSRGAQPPTIHILAFPHIIADGHLCVDAGLEKEDIAAYEAASEVRKGGPAESRTALWKRMGGRKADVLAAIAKAIDFGYLKEGASGEINLGSMPLLTPVLVRVPMSSERAGTDSGTDGETSAY